MGDFWVESQLNNWVAFMIKDWKEKIWDRVKRSRVVGAENSRCEANPMMREKAKCARKCSENMVCVVCATIVVLLL